MASFEDMRNKYYTEKGIEALSNRLKTIYSIYLDAKEEQYPLKFQMLGFPPLELESKEQCLGHVREIEQILLCNIGE